MPDIDRYPIRLPDSVRYCCEVRSTALSACYVRVQCVTHQDTTLKHTRTHTHSQPVSSVSSQKRRNTSKVEKSNRNAWRRGRIFFADIFNGFILFPSGYKDAYFKITEPRGYRLLAALSPTATFRHTLDIALPRMGSLGIPFCLPPLTKEEESAASSAAGAGATAAAPDAAEEDNSEGDSSRGIPAAASSPEPSSSISPDRPDAGASATASPKVRSTRTRCVRQIR